MLTVCASTVSDLMFYCSHHKQILRAGTDSGLVLRQRRELDKQSGPLMFFKQKSSTLCVSFVSGYCWCMLTHRAQACKRCGIGRMLGEICSPLGSSSWIPFGWAWSSCLVCWLLFACVICQHDSPMAVNIKGISRLGCHVKLGTQLPF